MLYMYLSTYLYSIFLNSPSFRKIVNDYRLKPTYSANVPGKTVACLTYNNRSSVEMSDLYQEYINKQFCRYTMPLTVSISTQIKRT